MNPVEKALWFVESHFAEAITLEDIAAVAGVSRHHMVRAFGAATGRPVMRYVRGRRLTEAARSLADGAPDILAVALDAGYESHEAFTRAFRDQFGLTPEKVRAARCLATLELVEPFRMTDIQTIPLSPPLIEARPALLLAGLSERYEGANAGMAAQWQRFAPNIGHIPGQVGQASYGVCYNGDGEGNIDYLCGVEVSDFNGLPADLARLRVAEQTYAIFTHSEHISTIQRTWATIFSQWFPQSGRERADAPEIEYYDERFDPVTGNGGFEIWIPLKG
jgi:AraC family transcriptional regulator